MRDKKELQTHYLFLCDVRFKYRGAHRVNVFFSKTPQNIFILSCMRDVPTTPHDLTV